MPRNVVVRKKKKATKPGRSRTGRVQRFVEGEHPRGRAGQFVDKPGAGDDAPRGASRHARALPKPADREPSPGSKVGEPEHLHSTERERQVAELLGGKYVGRRNGKDLPFDALVRVGKSRHAVEVKTLSKGTTDGIKVHADALVRKADYATRRPDRTVHTIAIDDRAEYGGGAFKDNSSGHQLYYKRGAGRFPLAKMHMARDMDEINRLVRMKDADLPEAARAPAGWPPSGAERKRIEALAEKDHAGRLARQQKARAEGRGWKPKPKDAAARALRT